MQRTPVDSRDTCDLPLVHRLDEDLQMLQWRRRQDPVPEIEDVARPAAGTAENVAGALAHKLRRPEEHRRIEVALDAAVVADPIPARVERHPPVQRYDVWSRGRYRLEHPGCVRAEVDPGHARRAERREDGAGMGED